METLSHVRNSSRYPRLPPELFRPIFEHLDGHRPTLCALALCNSHLHEDAERALYAILDESSAADTSVHIAFLTTITQNHHLASYVRAYHSIINLVRYEEAPLWNLSYQALRCMSGLKVLHFRMFGGHPAAELLLDAPFQLEKMHWRNHSEDAGTMAAVLEQQQHLKHLDLLSQEGTTFPLICCPNLRALSGNRVTLEALLPGRHMEDVEWVPDLDDDTSGGLRQIEAELGHLKRLSFGGYFARPHFALIVDYVKRLEKLELVGLISDELMLLKCIKPLRELVLSFQWGSGNLPIPREIDQRRRLVDELFSWCPNLLCVDITKPADIAPISYQRWTREKMQSSPVIVSMTEARYGRFGGGESRRASNI